MQEKWFYERGVILDQKCHMALFCLCYDEACECRPSTTASIPVFTSNTNMTEHDAPAAAAAAPAALHEEVDYQHPYC